MMGERVRKGRLCRLGKSQVYERVSELALTDKINRNLTPPSGHWERWREVTGRTSKGRQNIVPHRTRKQSRLFALSIWTMILTIKAMSFIALMARNRVFIMKLPVCSFGAWHYIRRGRNTSEQVIIITLIITTIINNQDDVYCNHMWQSESSL